LEDEMNKNKTKDQEQKPRRLSLNRETILVLNDPVLLGLVRGAAVDEEPRTSCNTSSSLDPVLSSPC
jgi:hypothetical protein